MGRLHQVHWKLLAKCPMWRHRVPRPVQNQHPPRSRFCPLRVISKLGRSNVSLNCFLPHHWRMSVCLNQAFIVWNIYTHYGFIKKKKNCFCFSSCDGRRHDVLFTCYTWPRLRTEPVQNAAGPGQKTNRNCFSYSVMSKAELSVVVSVTEWWWRLDIHWKTLSAAVCSPETMPASGASAAEQASFLGPLACSFAF